MRNKERSTTDLKYSSLVNNAVQRIITKLHSLPTSDSCLAVMETPIIQTHATSVSPYGPNPPLTPHTHANLSSTIKFTPLSTHHSNLVPNQTHRHPIPVTSSALTHSQASKAISTSFPYYISNPIQPLSPQNPVPSFDNPMHHTQSPLRQVPSSPHTSLHNSA